MQRKRRQKHKNRQGFYFALALFVVENTIHTNDRKTELIYVITDFFENSVNLREQISRRENDYNIEIGSSKNEQESEQNVNVNEINLSLIHI